MGKFDGILIISDMDGTLTFNRVLSDENAEAIRYFQENGGFFSLATGRRQDYIKQYEPKLVLNAPAAILNGTAVYDIQSDKVIFSCGLPKSAGEVVRYICGNYECITDVRCHSVTCSGFWNCKDDKDMQIEFEDEKFNKVLFVANDAEKMLKVKEDAEKRFPEYQFVRSWLTGLEMYKKDAGKGEAIKYIKKGLPIKKVIGVGDFENDISLIEYADIGYAAKNSAPMLLKKADRIACDCREHILRYIINETEKEL